MNDLMLTVGPCCDNKSHTPEMGWNWLSIHGVETGGAGGRQYRPEVARRIIAAVNACRGMSTEELEEGLAEGLTLKGTMDNVVLSFEIAMNAEAKAIRERDEARAMVKELAKWLEDASEETGHEGWALLAEKAKSILATR